MVEVVSIGIVLRSFALGGSERIAIRLARQWAACGHQVTLLMGSSEGRQATLLADTVPTGALAIITAPPGKLEAAKGKARSGRAFGEWCGEEANARNLSVLFVPGNSYYPAIRAMRKSAGPQTRIIAQISNPIVRTDKSALRNFIFSWICRYRLKAVTTAVAMSPNLASDARRALGKHIAVATVTSPILDAANFKEAKRARDGERNPKQLCVVARLEAQKNVEFAISALAALPDREMVLHIAGDGRLRHSLEAHAVKLGVDKRVIFHGILDDVTPLFRQSAALLLTSNFEGYPAVAVESLAQGTPVIARRCSNAMEEILTDHRHGRIVETRCPIAYAQTVTAFLSQPPAARQIDAKDQYTRYDITSVAQSYERLFAPLSDA